MRGWYGEKTERATIKQFTVLCLLDDFSRVRPVDTAALSRRAKICRPRLSMILTRFERNGWVERKREGHNRATWHLTTSGQSAQWRMPEGWVKMTENETRILRDRPMEFLRRLLRARHALTTFDLTRRQIWRALRRNSPGKILRVARAARRAERPGAYVVSILVGRRKGA